MNELKPKEIKICEEYLVNGFQKGKAYGMYYPNQNSNTVRIESFRFFQKPHIKEYIEMRLKESIGSTEVLTNKLITQLEYDCFEKECDGEFTYSHKQKSMELLIKLQKQQLDMLAKTQSNEDMVIDVRIVED